MSTMYKVYYIDQKNNRHEAGEFEQLITALTEALNAIFDTRWAKCTVVEHNGEVYRKYFA